MNKDTKEEPLNEPFDEQLEKRMIEEYKEIHPAVLDVLKEGMKNGQKRSEEGPGIDKIQLDAAKAAATVSQYYIEQLVGKPLTRAEISGKNGAPLSVNLKFVLDEESDPEGGIKTSIDNETGDTKQNS